jgi:hypothetical protein
LKNEDIPKTGVVDNRISNPDDTLEDIEPITNTVYRPVGLAWWCRYLPSFRFLRQNRNFLPLVAENVVLPL